MLFSLLFVIFPNLQSRLKREPQALGQLYGQGLCLGALMGSKEGGHGGYDLAIPTKQVGAFDTELVQEFFLGFVRNAGATLHVRKIAGTNSHHIIEGAFKSVARSLRDAVAIDSRFADAIPSTKGVLQ